MTRSRIVLGMLGLLLAVNSTVAGSPRELGRIGWRRDLDEGIAQAKEAERPILLLFQEVPG